MLRSLRATLDARGFVEVETPVLQLTNGGAAARPFRTHLNAFDQDMLLRIALELDLKKAMVGGVDRVYEIGRTFRNEGLDSTHAAEFSMLEAYQAYGDYDTMADLDPQLVVNAAARSAAPSSRRATAPQIDLEGEWRHATLLDLVSEAVGEQSRADTPCRQAARASRQARCRTAAGWGAGDIVLELYEKLVEHTLIQPTFVRDYPEAVRPLAKPHREIRAWSRRSTSSSTASSWSPPIRS